MVGAKANANGEDPGTERTPSDGAGGSTGKDGGKGPTSGDDDPGTNGLGSVTLRNGTTQLLGVTTGSTPMAVYLFSGAQSLSLEAVPVGGGSPTVIAMDLTGEEDYGISGGAVWWYTAINASGIGTVNFWTKANGAKTAVASGSIDGFFWASEDGSRVAFSVAGSAKTTNVAVTGSDAPSATAVLQGNYSLDFPTSECFPDVGFVGTTLFAAFCSVQTVGSPNSTAARIVSVDGAGAVRRLDAANNANNTIALSATKPLWYANTTGTKVFVIGAGAGQGRILDVATAPATGAVTALETGVVDGYLLDDGTAIYATGTAVKRGNGTGPAKTLTTTIVKSFLTRTPTGDRLIFRSLDPAGNNGLVDLRTITTSSENQSTQDLVSTASVTLSGLDGNGTHVFYVSDVVEDANGLLSGVLKALPMTGGTEIILAKGSPGGVPIPGTNSIIAAGDAALDTDGNVLVSVAHVNVNTTLSLPIAKEVIPNAWGFSGKRFIYTRAGSNPGIYAVDIP
ncbi:hypothetical protein AKJ09_07692 [Labilithrix luteola]|uniref:Uncharacterized protein n=1 Tax=Labilithrix luteola TaxID=1391654 RepID=A0A0K1Q5M7_9BACT|nr:hypothetical protein AKJ09_07692 [Labilithrix luteola]